MRTAIQFFVLAISLCGSLAVPVRAQEPVTSPAMPPRSVEQPADGCLHAQYPEVAKRFEATGVTRIVFVVEASGAVTNAAIAKSSGTTRAHRELDSAALRAVSSCKFAEAPGHASRRVAQEFVWRLEQTPSVPDNQRRR